MGALVQPLLTHFKRRQKVAETPLGRFNYKLTGWHKGIVGLKRRTAPCERAGQ
jgi:hypothetical protein